MASERAAGAAGRTCTSSRNHEPAEGSSFPSAGLCKNVFLTSHGFEDLGRGTWCQTATGLGGRSTPNLSTEQPAAPPRHTPGAARGQLLGQQDRRLGKAPGLKITLGRVKRDSHPTRGEYSSGISIRSDVAQQRVTAPGMTPLHARAAALPHTQRLAQTGKLQMAKGHGIFEHRLAEVVFQLMVRDQLIHRAQKKQEQGTAWSHPPVVPPGYPSHVPTAGAGAPAPAALGQSSGTAHKRPKS